MEGLIFGILGYVSVASMIIVVTSLSCDTQKARTITFEAATLLKFVDIFQCIFLTKSNFLVRSTSQFDQQYVRDSKTC